MAYLILRTDKVKSMGQLAALSAHHTRSRETPNADPEGEVRFFVGSGVPYEDVKQFMERHKLRKRKNGVLAVEALLTASPAYFRPDDPNNYGHYSQERVDAFTDAALNWLHDHFGQENVVSAVLHLDEATPHVQAVVVPMDTTPRQRGPQARLNARRWLGGRDKMSRMQTDAAKAFAHLGLMRGVEGSAATHKTLREYYGEINATGIVAEPAVSPPPVLLTEKSRAGWAAQVTETVAQQMQPVMIDAKKARIAEKQRREALQTARRKSAEVDELAARMRDIPLRYIFAEYGWKQDPTDRSKWVSPEGTKISVTDQLWHHWSLGEGGGGSIDLLMQLEQMQSGTRPDFLQALSMLADRFGEARAASALAANARDVVQHAARVAKSFAKPEPAEANWPRVREYLVEQRGLSEVVVDHFHGQGLIYADSRNNAVFWNGREVAELRGTGERSWKGLAVGSKRMAQGGFRFRASGLRSTKVVLVESAIDALSYYDLHGPGAYTIASTAGALPDAPFIQEYKLQGLEVACAYDNDMAGEAAYTKMEKGVERVCPPPGNKDWNDALRQKPDETRGTDMKEEGGMDLQQ